MSLGSRDLYKLLSKGKWIDMLKEEELDGLLKSFIGSRIVIRINTSYTAGIVKFKLADITFSGGFHRSSVSDAMIEDRNVSLHDDNLNVTFAFEYKDLESVVKSPREKCELHVIYRDGTDVRIYKEVNF